MNAANWIAVMTPALALVGAGSAGVAKLTRMAVAIENLAKLLQAAAQIDTNHEARIAALEKHQPPAIPPAGG